MQNVISVLDVMFSVAEAIPVFGTPLKGALESLFKILANVEVSNPRTSYCVLSLMGLNEFSDAFRIPKTLESSRRS